MYTSILHSAVIDERKVMDAVLRARVRSVFMRVLRTNVDEIDVGVRKRSPRQGQELVVAVMVAVYAVADEHAHVGRSERPDDRLYVVGVDGMAEDELLHAYAAAVVAHRRSQFLNRA